MDSREPKHKQQFTPQHDYDQETYGLPDSECPRTDNNEDEIGMFYALIDRMQATNKMMMHKSATFGPAEATSIAAGNIEAKIMTSKSPWKPSFKWEDFSCADMLFGGNCGSSNLRGFANNSADASKEIQKLDIGSGEGRLVCSRPFGSFDLNEEAPSEHPVPSAL